MKPPMNDIITIFVPQLDPKTGKPLKDKYGREIGAVAAQSIARVAHTMELIVGNNGEQVEAKLEVDVPRETYLKVGLNVEWLDRKGEVIKGQIENFEEVLNYSGKKVYFQTFFVT